MAPWRGAAHNRGQAPVPPGPVGPLLSDYGFECHDRGTMMPDLRRYHVLRDTP